MHEPVVAAHVLAGEVLGDVEILDLSAMREGRALASKRVIATMPERQARMLSQATATPVPTGDTIPIPVITTRRLDMS
jgi:hypothetical protein